ncbi:MAG: periplasmic molybdate-binding protein/domain protein [Planctomycetota bacterium]|nr:periplasmic molybdate-binding protein/domain protein [Planctomycetota bacterium]
MSDTHGLENQVRQHRGRRGWSQDELAERSGLSRAGISGIETGRLVPSTSAALSLAEAFQCRVEDLFRLPRSPANPSAWAWSPRGNPCRYWRAEVGARTLLIPAETSPLAMLAHDGISRDGQLENLNDSDPRDTLVIACCDPAVGLLAAELARSANIRLVALPRASKTALSMLGQRVVHVAGVHLTHDGDRAGNAAAVRSELGEGYTLLRVASWEAGIASAPTRRIESVRAANNARLRWVGREVGSGARQCLDELLGHRRPPRRLASDHRGVAEAVRNGWADAGVCLRLVCEEAGLAFFGIRHETYDLCFPDALREDRRIVAMVQAVRTTNYRRILSDLPGYDPSEAGQLHPAL